jgi:recombination protein RecA
MIMVKPKELAAEINKVLGTGTVLMGNDKSLEVQTIPTGVAPIDFLLKGGVPKGRFTELFGAYSTLKSYVGLRTIAECQKLGGVAAIIDTEHAYEPEWAESLGVDTESLIYQSPQSGEEAIDLAEVLVRNGVDLIVWDSIAASLPQAEGQKRLANESVQPARLAALMSTGLRKLTTANRNTAIICINQTRLNVGQMFGDPEVVPGGRALPFYASHRIALRKAGKIKDGTKALDTEGKQANISITTAHKIRATLEKSKLTAPSQDVLFSFDLESGAVDEVGFLITQGLLDGVISQEGRRWWIEGKTEPIVGRAKFRESLEADPTMIEVLKEAVFNSDSLGQ